MELRHLETFRLLAKSLSFTRTAAERHYAQSTITNQIQTLEAELGVALFDRLGRRVTLTEAGQHLLPYAERLLELAAEVRAALTESAEIAGTIAFSAPESICTYLLPPFFGAVRARYPGIRLSFQPLSSAGLLPALRDGVVDLAFLLDHPQQVKGFGMIPLAAEPLLLLAPPEHPLADRQRVEPTDLRDEPVLLTEVGCSYRTLFVRDLTAAGVHPTTVLELSSVEAIKQCVLAGMGLTLLPAMTVSAELAQGRLKALAWVGPTQQLISQAIWRQDRWQSPARRAILGVIQQLWPPPPTITPPVDK